LRPIILILPIVSALTVLALGAQAANAAGDAPVPAPQQAAAPAPQQVAQASEELAPYDAGYAYKASQACPGVTLLVPMGAEAQASPEFKRGVAMFDRYLELQKAEGACKAALNLYDSKTGKAYKVLERK
jgi:hypothetical protein